MMTPSHRQRRLQSVEQLEDRNLLALGAGLVLDLNQGPADSDPKSAVDFGGTLFFSAIDAARGRGLYRLDEATGVATRFTNVPADQNNLFPEELTSLGSKFYFAAATDGSGPLSQLWQSDGTSAGTTVVADDPNYLPRGLTEFNGDLLYYHPVFSGGTELWKVDNATGAMMLSPLGDDPQGLANVAGTMFFYIADDGVGSPVQIWKTDGTPSGTVLVRTLSGRSVGDTAELNGRYFFSANGTDSDGNHIAGLYKSDGSYGGTRTIFSITAPDVFIRDVVNVNGTLFFNVLDDSGAEPTIALWKSNGFPGGTVKVSDNGDARTLANVNGVLWFTGHDAEHGFELWTSDGTDAGTRLLYDFNPGLGDGFPETAHVTVVGGNAFLRAEDGVHGVELWASDGTAAGTRMITDSPDGTSDAPLALCAVGDTLYLSAVDELHGRELWKVTDQIAPTLGGGGAVTFVENADSLTIWPSARVSEPDSPNFKFGQLRLTVASGSDANDRLGIQNQGTGPDQIGVSGGVVTYGGEPIGKRGGDGTSTLSITFNGQTTSAVAQALVRALIFRTLGDDPSTAARTLNLQVSDGDGGWSNVINKTINIDAVNDPPRLVLGGTVAYQNNAHSILLAPSATVSDVDSAFIGGLMNVDITSGRGPTNRLLASGAYSIQSGQLLRDGVVVGTVLADGIGWHAMRIRFNDQMTTSRVQELIRSLRFRTIGNTNLDSRVIAFDLTDGDGGASATQAKTVNVTA